MFRDCISVMKSPTIILMYHSVSDKPAFFAVTPDMFESQMKYIHDKNVATVFASEVPDLLKGASSRRVCITVDDGYEDFFLNAFPILKKYGIRSTVFLITDLIGGTLTEKNHSAAILTEDQIRQLLASGLVEFMPHTHTHPNLDQIPFEEAVREIETSRARVAALTGEQSDIFAFPRGRYTTKLLDHMRSGGWHAAFSVERGVANEASDVMQLPRLAVDSATSMRAFRAAVSGSIRWYRILKAINFRLGLNV